MSASGNRNILRTGQEPRMPNLAPDGSVISHSNLTQQQSNARNELSSAFSRLVHDQHFTLVRGGRLVVELNIEGGSGSGAAGVNNNNSSSQAAAAAAGGLLCSSCGKNKKTVQPQSAGDDDVDLNSLPGEIDDQHFCRCEHHHPLVQETENPPATAVAAVTEGSVGTPVLPRNAVGPMIQRGSAIESGGMQSFHGSGMLTSGQDPNSQIYALHFHDRHHHQPLYRRWTNTNVNHMVGQMPTVALEVAVGQPSPAYYQNHNLVIRPVMQQQQPRSRFAGANGMIDPRVMDILPYHLPGPAAPNLPGDLQRPQGEAGVVDISDDENDEVDIMHLDIEQMAYEEILVLEEHIGNVNTGLSEDAIMEHLVRRYYRVPNQRPPEHAELCSICLVEFENRDVMGRISCTHKYHFDCIKQWLMRQNCCPMCKRNALAVPQEPDNNNNNN